MSADSAAPAMAHHVAPSAKTIMTALGVEIHSFYAHLLARPQAS